MVVGLSFLGAGHWFLVSGNGWLLVTGLLLLTLWCGLLVSGAKTAQGLRLKA